LRYVLPRRLPLKLALNRLLRVIRRFGYVAATRFHQGIAPVSGRKAGERQTYHIAFELNDIRTLRDKLKANRAEFFQDLHDAPYGLTAYVADPDGTTVELYKVGEKA
jgi:ureidoacrylate peracid hydrolase